MTAQPQSHRPNGSGEVRTSGLAIAALAIAVVPCCLTSLVGVVLGIVALGKINREGLGGRGLAIAAIIVGSVLTIPGLGITAAIAIPNFVRFQARSKQSEAKANLRALYTAAKAFEAEKGAAPKSLTDLDWHPSGIRRFTYFLGEDTLQATAGGPYELPAGVEPGADVLGIAVGNVDNDPELDVWTVDASGRLECVVNDVTGPSTPGPQGRAPTLEVSKWTGSVAYQNQRYPFTLAITRVETNGTFEGLLTWPQQNVTSAVRGVANGNHLVFTDEDGDEKDVRIEGTSMIGTDKGGAAGWEAVQVQ